MPIGAVISIVLLSAIYGALLNIFFFKRLIKAGHIPRWMKELGIDYTIKDPRIREMVLRSEKTKEVAKASVEKEKMMAKWKLLKSMLWPEKK